jgi:hypothetical protein
MRLALPLLVVVCLLGPLGCAASGSQGSPVLPLRKVRLYETGVGYFEREGALGDGSSLPVPSGHLDDALKSLVVLGKDAQLDHVSFESRVSPAVARARAGLPSSGEMPVGFQALLASLHGENIEASDGERRVRGRLVDVVREAISRPDERAKGSTDDAEGDAPGEAGSGSTEDPAPEEKLVELAVILTDDGAFIRLEVARLVELSPLDPKIRQRYATALDAQADLRTGAQRALALAGDSGAPVRIGYLAEAAIWRTSYRIVVGSGKPTIQAWALVHNDTEEPWAGVSLELTSGRPDSFLFPLAAPRYERRELLSPDRELSSVPQLLGQSPDALWGDFVEDAEGAGGFGLKGYGSGGGGGTGYGYGAGRAGISQRSVVTSSNLLDVGNLATIAEAEGEETETSFVYRAHKPLDLAPHRSALVPFLQRPIEADTVSLFDDFTPGARFAIHLKNTTGQTLPTGPVGVFASGGFAGEAILARLTSGERQLFPIGDDPDTELDVLERQAEDKTKRVESVKENVVQHYLRTRRVSFELTNRSGHARTVLVQLHTGQNAKIEGADRVDFDRLGGRPLAIFELAPRARDVHRDVTIVEGLSRSIDVDGVSSRDLLAWAAEGDLPAAEVQALRDLAALQSAVEKSKEELATAQADVKRVEEDIVRLREHLKALGDQGEAGNNPLVTRVLAAEDKLEAARAKVASKSDEIETRRRAVQAGLEPLRRSSAPAP